MFWLVNFFFSNDVICVFLVGRILLFVLIIIILVFKLFIRDVNFKLIIFLFMIVNFCGSVFNFRILLFDSICLWLNLMNGRDCGDDLVVISIFLLGSIFDLLFLYFIEIVLFWGENIDVFIICLILL